jgi:hypothetical protein
MSLEWDYSSCAHFACVCTRTHLLMHPRTHLFMFPCTHLLMHPRTHLLMFPCTHLVIHPSTHARTCSCIHARIRAYIRAAMHTCIRPCEALGWILSLWRLENALRCRAAMQHGHPRSVALIDLSSCDTAAHQSALKRLLLRRGLPSTAPRLQTGSSSAYCARGIQIKLVLCARFYHVFLAHATRASALTDFQYLHGPLRLRRSLSHSHSHCASCRRVDNCRLPPRRRVLRGGKVPCRQASSGR